MKTLFFKEYPGGSVRGAGHGILASSPVQDLHLSLSHFPLTKTNLQERNTFCNNNNLKKSHIDISLVGDHFPLHRCTMPYLDLHITHSESVHDTLPAVWGSDMRLLTYANISYWLHFQSMLAGHICINRLDTDTV